MRSHCEVPWNDTRKDPHAQLDHTRTTRCPRVHPPYHPPVLSLRRKRHDD